MAACGRALAFIVLVAATAGAQPRVTTPKEEFGFNFGGDSQPATYRQLSAYWQKLDRESERLTVHRMGQNSIERGRSDQWTPAPHRYGAIAQRMNVPLAGGRGAAPNAERDMAFMARTTPRTSDQFVADGNVMKKDVPSRSRDSQRMRPPSA